MFKHEMIDKNAFTVRKPNLKIWHLALIGCLIESAILVTMNYGSETAQYIITIIISFAIIGLLYLVQNRGTDQRTATEFQALVYSGAMRVNSMLTLIVYSDGSIFYLDPRYMSDFSNGSQYHNLDQFLTTIGVENPNKNHIYDAIKDLQRVEFEYVYKDGRSSAPMQIGIFPLPRPTGFVVLTIREKVSSTETTK